MIQADPLHESFEVRTSPRYVCVTSAIEIRPDGFSRSVAMRKGVRAALFGLTLAATLSAHAAGNEAPDIAAGQKRFAVCASCHGTNGHEPVTPRFPKIGGQNGPYLVAALKAYRDGGRSGGDAALMASMAKPLSDTDITNLAAYIATLGHPG